MNTLRKLLLATVLLPFAGCGLFGPEPLIVPSAYDPSTFATHTVQERALRDHWSALSRRMEQGRDPGTTLNIDELGMLFNSGSPSLSSFTHPYYRDLIDNWLLDLATASGRTFDVQTAPLGNGGVYGGYLLDEHGLEVQQMIEQGLLISLFYYEAYQLMFQRIDETSSDRLLALYGAHPDFPNSDNGSLHPNPDVLMARYAAHRDLNDSRGFYNNIELAFIQIQAAAKGGFDYGLERDEALLALRVNWGEAHAATIIHHLDAAVKGFRIPNPSEEQLGEALHRYAQALGLIHGWRMLPIGARLISEVEIDTLLTKLKAAPGQAPQSYLFATSPSTEVAQLEAAIDDLQRIYGFTDAQMLQFEKNWVAEQNR